VYRSEKFQNWRINFRILSRETDEEISQALAAEDALSREALA